jgi:hypothetical protein
MTLLNAPWNEDQVQSLNKFQEAGCFHPFTCGGVVVIKDKGPPYREDCRCDLVATTEGWKCPNCSYTQDWCHEFMADWSWKRMTAYRLLNRSQKMIHLNSPNPPE